MAKWAQEAGVPALTQAHAPTQKSALGYCLTLLMLKPHEGLDLRPAKEGSHHHNRISAAAGPAENKTLEGTI